MGDTKEILRARAAGLRDCLPSSEIVSKSRLIQRTALRFAPYLHSRAVALYSPSRNEVATEDIREHALKAGKKLFYPKLGTGMDLHLVRLEDPAHMKLGRFGILEPLGDVTLTKDDEQGLAVFVPGLGFDVCGNRIGRGKGWYDRLLTELELGTRVSIGLAFECQILDGIPVDRWDQKVDHIITESRVIDCGDSRPIRDGIPN
jgi:5-formyltetrahydrofolate cyclo-ligase